MRLGVNGRFLTARPTGVQRYAHELLAALSTLTDPVLFVPRGARPAGGVAARLEAYEGRSRGPLYEQLELPVAARHARADVVLGPANAAPLVGGPHVVVLHDVLPLLRPGDYTLRYRAWVRVAHVAAARRAAAVVTVSAWSADQISRCLGIPRSRMTVIPQGVGPLDAPAEGEPVAEMRRRLDLDGPYFLAVTGGDPRKGAGFLEELWRDPTWQAGGNATLVVVGGAHRGVHRPLPGRDHAPAVLRLGSVSDDDLRALYTGSVALLHPASAEGFGRPPLEALACGTRAIVAPYGPASEVLGDAADIMPLDPKRWGAALGAALGEPDDERARRVDLGRRHAARYTWAETARMVLAVCEAVAAGTDRSGATLPG